MTDDRPGTVDPTAAGEGVDGVPVLERDETDTRGVVTMRTTDVTAWCPYEGTADYYGVTITYQPERYVVELVSLRDYFQSYREEAISHEDFAGRVFCHLTTLLNPAWLRLTVECPPRYGIETTIVHDTREGGPADDEENPADDGSTGGDGIDREIADGDVPPERR